MAQERPITPEKQLLNLIENGKAGHTDFRAQAAKHKGMSLFSGSAWRGRFSFFRDNMKVRPGHAMAIQPSIKILNGVLLAAAALLATYLIFGISASVKDMYRARNFNINVKESEITSIPKAVSLLKQSASYYVEDLGNRDVFKIRGTRVKEQRGEEVVYKAPTSKLPELIANLKLVGISWSSDPDAMVEDTAALKTLFIKRGSMIGPVKVQAILKDKVILSYEGEETELR